MDWKTRDSVYQLLGAVDIYFNGFWMTEGKDGCIEV
jgi:hypothetical protein